MPALMVRNFPLELHQKLKEEAKQKHRSMAQQLIAVMEERYSLPDQRPYDRAEIMARFGLEEPILLKRPMSDADLKRWRREGLE